MKPGFYDSESAIAYGVALAVVVVLMLMGVWISLAPVVDGLRDVTVDLNADDPTLFSDELVTRVNIVYDIWGYICFSFVAAPLLYVIVRAIRQQGVE
jgi:hypothetical protein